MQHRLKLIPQGVGKSWSPSDTSSEVETTNISTLKVSQPVLHCLCVILELWLQLIVSVMNKVFPYRNDLVGWYTRDKAQMYLTRVWNSLLLE